MLTQKGANTSVVGISGNFDDAQSGVKKIFGDKNLPKSWQAEAISSLPQTPSTSVVSYHRLYTMYMRMQNCLKTARSRTVRRSM